MSVESGTTNRDFLISTSKKLVKQGKKAITIVTFPKDTDSVRRAARRQGRRVLRRFAAGRVLREAEPTKVEVGGNPINPFPVGIAIRKADPLRAATQKAIAAMYASGEMKRIVAKWGMTKAVVLLKK